ncbi:MAG: OprO/OprP family phosphate-selective porin [Planctomycetes bacterium]|nr:OprO/OprP family phosphate-selective porin [Planctomycetota bacterium]
MPPLRPVWFGTAVVLAAVFAGLCAPVVYAQSPFEPDSSTELSLQSDHWSAQTLTNYPTEPSAIDQLSNRLLETEARLNALQQAQQQNQIYAEASGRSLGDALRERFEQIQDPAITTVDQETRHAPGSRKSWFDRLSIRGFAQMRYNEILWDDPDGAPPHHVGDESVGINQNFLLRRARVILSGDVSDHMFVFIQADLASNIPGSPDANHYSQLRDCFGDVYFDEDHIHRLRIGLTKVPYGWENLQAVSNRIPIDRNDGLNSGVRNERDLGLFYYYTPEFAQDLFKYVLDNGLKGSGNFGLFGLGVYNGQGGSLREQNDNLHMVARLTWPMQFENGQIIETSIQGYTGKFVVLTSPIEPLGVPPTATPAVAEGGYLDQRVAGTFVYYPQPIGFQAEWNVGRGPVLDAAQTEVVDGSLTGGYAMTMYRWQTECYGTLFPYVRYHYYSGGYKGERNAPDALISSGECGVEWQFNPQMELTVELNFLDRTNTVAQPVGESYQQFVGNLLRVQFQMNY